MGDATIATDIREGVSDLTDALGKISITLRVTAKGAFIDASNPSKGKGTTVTNYTFQGVITGFDADLVDGVIIQRDDKKLIMDLTSMSPSEQVPTTDDLIIDGSDTWKIINRKLVEVAGMNVTAVLQLRR